MSFPSKKKIYHVLYHLKKYPRLKRKCNNQLKSTRLQTLHGREDCKHRMKHANRPFKIALYKRKTQFKLTQNTFQTQREQFFLTEKEIKMSSTSIFFFFLFCSLILSLDWLILVTLFCFYLVGFTHLCFVFVNYGLFAMLCVRYLLGHFYFVSCIHYFIYVLFLLIIVCLLCYMRGIWLLEILSGVFVA